MNKVIIGGNLVDDPKLFTTKTGLEICRFTVAVDDHDKTNFFKTVTFGKYAEILHNYLKKGSPVFIEGRLSQRSYEKNDEKRWVTEIIVERCDFRNGKKRNAGNVKDENDIEPF